jgi:TolA-binding protein
MKTTIHSLIAILIITFGFRPMMGVNCIFASPKNESVEHIKEDLVNRLVDESEKIDSIMEKMTYFQEFISELRNIEVYPSDLFRVADSILVKFDKGISSLEQQYKEVNGKVSLNKASFKDAMEILREMVINEPVNSMFTVLKNGNKKRINELDNINKQIDRLWRSGDSLVDFVMNQAVETQKIEMNIKEFHEREISYDDYYKKFEIIKVALGKKANIHQLNELFKIEKYNLNKLMEMEKYNLARKKIISLIDRYTDKKGELNLLLAKVEFYLGNFRKVLSTIEMISETGRYRDQLLAMKIQSLYSLKEYEIIWHDYRNYDLTGLESSVRNLVVWILIESGLALRIENNYSQLASLMDNRGSYKHHILHALSRTYLLTEDKQTALSIMETALKHKVLDENDRIALREIRLALAQLYYDMNEYEKSLNLFYDILNKHEDYEKALFGIIWCYIKLGNHKKTDIALRKLINLKPESPYATEAIYILARKYLVRANEEWKKIVYLDKEEKRLESKLNLIIEKKNKNTRKEDAPKYDYACDELKSLLERLKKESRMNYDSLKSMYERIESVCNMVSNHYRTGTFQENILNANGEKLLFLLDSMINKIESGSAERKTRLISNAIQNRIKIKEILKKTQIFAVIAGIDRFRWEREFLEWKKAEYREKEIGIDSSIALAQDSITLKQLKKKKNMISSAIDSLVDSEDRLISSSINLLKGRIDTLLKMELDDADAAYLNYQYGELAYTEENMNYSVLYERYEMEMDDYSRQLEDFRNGTRLNHPVKPQMPVLDHGSSMEKFKTVINLYPNSEYCASSLYSLAWCYNDISKNDSAMYFMGAIIRNYLTSSYAPQAWMYSGEYYFDKGELDSAIICYQSVLKYPESEWFEEALYKLAWSQYRLSNPEKAISSFLALVDLGDAALSGASLLEKESMDYIAISFSEADVTGEKGLQRALLFAEKLKDNEKGCRILQRLASVFREQGRYGIAKNTYTSMLKMYPAYPKNPVVESELVKLLEREPAENDINGMKRNIYEKYNRNSEWAKAQSEDIKREADSIAQKHLYEAAIGYHQNALQKNDSGAYQNALGAYREIITVYPESEVANECHYNLAEIQFAIGNYYEAAEEYMAVTRRYPDSKYREIAAWNAIVASQNLMRMENDQ